MFKTFSEILGDLFNSIIASGGKITDFNIGSVTRTILEAVAAAVEEVWFYLDLYTNKFFISSSEGQWLDRRLNDFGLYRKKGAAATGSILISRSTPAPIGMLIPAGSLFITDQSIQIKTVVDGVLPLGSLSIEVQAIAVSIGIAGNLPQNTPLKQAGIAIVGIETVTVSHMGGGIDRETDDELKARVKLYFESLGRSTRGAIEFAALSVQGVKVVTVVENSPVPGFFKVYIDDGTGGASDVLILAVSNAVDFYRGFTIHHSILAPKRINVSIAASVETQEGYIPAEVKANVRTALLKAVNGLKMGNQLYVASLYQAAMNVAGVKNLSITDPAMDTNIAIDEIARTVLEQVGVT